MRSFVRILPCLVCSTVLVAPAFGYQRYTDGCDDCHGGFRSTPYTSLRDEARWPDSLHDVHRNSEFMSSDCGTCHVTNGDNARTNLSRAGFGCSGCHGQVVDGEASGAGLREHHRITGASACASGCHAPSEATLPESVRPAFFGTALTRVDDPCDAASEDFSGDGVGLDNDGDGLYDSADPDCSGVVNEPPVADFSATQERCTFRVSFTDASTDPDDAAGVVAWAWDFQGDGTVDATEADPTFDFGAAGSFTVSLTVTDSGGETASKERTVVVAGNELPVAGFDVAQEGANVQFTDASTDADGEVASRSWDFGDGGTSEEASPAHAYDGPGAYTAVLTVTDDCGDSATAEAVVTVSSDEPLFVRGDADGSGALDITDGVAILGFLFLGSDPPGCEDAADVDDNESLAITDAILVLNFLFLGGAPPAAPFGVCGPDPDGGTLGCDTYAPCSA